MQLVASILLSMAILGVTVIQTGLQVRRGGGVARPPVSLCHSRFFSH